MQTIVKICGMTDAASIQTAIDHKVDYLGFVFYEKSPRNLTPKQATKLTKNIPSHINKVAVIVNETNQFIEYIQKDFDYLQLHGDEDLKRVKELKKNIIKRLSKPLKSPMKLVQKHLKNLKMKWICFYLIVRLWRKVQNLTGRF